MLRQILFFFGHRNFMRNKTQTAVINMVMLLLISYLFLNLNLVVSFIDNGHF